MDKFLKISQYLSESDSYSLVNLDLLKAEPGQVPKHIHILQGRVKSHSGAELTGQEAVSALKRIKSKFPKEWQQVMAKQEDKEKSWMGI